MTGRQCDRLVATSIDPPELIECGLPIAHEGPCDPDPELLDERKRAC